MNEVQKLLQEDIAFEEKQRIFLASVRYLRKSEHSASYNEMLRKISGLAADIAQEQKTGVGGG